MPAPQEFTAPIRLLKQCLVKAPYVTTCEPGLGWQPTQMRAGLLKLQRTWYRPRGLEGRLLSCGPELLIQLVWAEVWTFTSSLEVWILQSQDHISRISELDTPVSNWSWPWQWISTGGKRQDPQHKTHLFWLKRIIQDLCLLSNAIETSLRTWHFFWEWGSGKLRLYSLTQSHALTQSTLKTTAGSLSFKQADEKVTIF